MGGEEEDGERRGEVGGDGGEGRCGCDHLPWLVSNSNLV